MRHRVIGMTALASGVALSACAMPMDGYGTYPPQSYAPPAYSASSEAFSEAADDYAWIDRADALWEAIGDAPPDHAFAFEGAEPWAWVTPEGYTIIVEDGAAGIRTYYFEPGDDGPFLASEPGGSFGYAGGRLAVAYGPDGGVLAGAVDLDAAMRLHARGRRLRQAMEPAAYEPVDSQAWIDSSLFLFGFREEWDAGRSRHPGWRAYRSDDAARAWRQRLESERLRRRGAADAFRRWREGGFEGPPPGRWRRPEDRRPGTNRPPRQPGQRWGRPGGPRPGTSTPRPPVAERPDGASPPGTGQRDGEGPRRWGNRPRDRGEGNPRRPDWRGARPQPPATTPSPQPDGEPPRRWGNRPGRDAGNPPRPDWRAPQPQPPAMAPAPQPGGEAPRRWGNRPGRDAGNPPRPDWRAPQPQPQPPATAPAPQPGGETPRRWGSRPGGGDGSGGRPDWRARRPQPPASEAAGPQPTPPNAGEARREWNRPQPQGNAPRPDAAPAPRSYSPPTPRPSYTPPTPRPSYTPPAPRPSYTPPTPRPAYTPPPRSAPAPAPRVDSAPRPAPTRPSASAKRGDEEPVTE